jgi:hypothetical protein
MNLEEKIIDIIKQLREEIRINNQRIKQISGGGGGGGGDMLKSVYDTNNDGIVDNSDKVDGKHASEFADVNHTHSGMGDMLKSVYDIDNDGVIDNAEKLEGHPASDFALTDHDLEEHGNTIITNKQEADFLVYDSDAQKWKNALGQAAGLIDTITYLLQRGNYCTQGICADADYIYVTDNDYIRKYRKSDNQWMGALQVSNKVSGYTHAGDCCYHNGVIYIAMSNYPTTPYKGCIIKVAADLTYLGYISLYGDHEASSVCRKPDGTFWVTSYSYLDPCKIFKYSPSWEYLGNYDLEKVDSNGQWGYDGIEWNGNYLYANVHDDADMGDYLDVYYFDGSTFSRVQRVNHTINGYICHQGIALDPAESNILWMVNRLGSVGYKTSLTYGAVARIGSIYFKGSKVGIDISNPAEALHVNGKVRASGDPTNDYDLATKKYVDEHGGGGATTFLGLADTPDSYSGQSGKIPKVKTDESGLEFADPATPGAHHTTHESGGDDAIKLDDLAPPDDTTDLDVSTSKHGLCPKAPNDITKFLRGDATWAVPEGGGGGTDKSNGFMPPMMLLQDAADYWCPYMIRWQNAVTTFYLVSNRLYLFPFSVEADITVSKIAIQVSGGAAGTYLSLAFYNSSDAPNRRPTTLIGYFEFDVGTSGVKSEIPSSLTFEKGKIYWAAFISNGTPTLKAAYNGDQIFTIFNLSGTTTNIYNSYQYDPGSYTVPYDLSGVTLTKRSGHCIMFFIR